MSELLSKLQRNFESLSERVALIFRGCEVTYARAGEATLRLARALRELGVEPGDRVAVMLPNLVQFPISYYAVLSIGATVVPINITYKEREIRYILEDSEARGIIAWEGFRHTIARAAEGLDRCSIFVYLGNRIPRGAHSLTRLQEQYGPLDSPLDVGEDEVAVVLYTAGTTGRPMGAELTHRNLAASAEILADQFALDKMERCLAVVPLYHAFGQAVAMNAPLMAGCTVVLQARFDPAELLRTLRQYEIHWFAAVPPMVRQLLQTFDGSEPPQALKFCVTSGGPISEEIVRKFEATFDARVLPGYGLTETFSLVSCTRLDREWRPGSVGQPLYGIDVAIWSDSGELLSPGTPGEVVVRGPTTMRGYLNRPKATDKVKTGDWLHTGDVGYLDDEGYLFLVDRKKDVIIKGGFSIFPSEIEQCIQAHPKVARAVVVGVPDEEQGEEVKAYVILREGQRATVEEIAEYCKERMALYKCPKYIEFCNSFPTSTTGRVLKRLLRQKGVAQVSRSVCDEVPDESAPGS